jgi:hypothetical protein
VAQGEGEGVLARLRQNERKALGRKRLELVDVQMKNPALVLRRVGPGEGGLRQAGDDKGAEEVGGAFPERALGKIDDQDAALVQSASTGIVKGLGWSRPDMSGVGWSWPTTVSLIVE